MEDKIKKWIISRPDFVKAITHYTLVKEFDISEKEALRICIELQEESILETRYSYRCSNCKDIQFGKDLYDIVLVCKSCGVEQEELNPYNILVDFKIKRPVKSIILY